MIAKQWKIPFTDTVQSVMSNLNKAVFMPSVQTQKIRHIPTYFAGRREVAIPEKKGISAPFLIKPVHGRHGEGIQIKKNEKALEAFLKKNKKEMMIQSFLNIEEEYRVFVIGKETLGVVKKTPEPGSKIANYAAGATFTKTIMTHEIVKEAIAVCQSQGIDIGGVDLAKVGSSFYLLEVNRCPEFKAFAKATDVDVANKIIHFTKSKK